jgi:hypothetical protein
MSYLHIFPIGEVLRSGVGPEARYTRITVPGYIALGLLQYNVFSPVYFICLVINWRKISKQRNEAQSTVGGDGEPAHDRPRWAMK